MKLVQHLSFYSLVLCAGLYLTGCVQEEPLVPTETITFNETLPNVLESGQTYRLTGTQVKTLLYDEYGYAPNDYAEEFELLQQAVRSRLNGLQQGDKELTKSNDCLSADNYQSEQEDTPERVKRLVAGTLCETAGVQFNNLTFIRYIFDDGTDDEDSDNDVFEVGIDSGALSFSAKARPGTLIFGAGNASVEKITPGTNGNFSDPVANTGVGVQRSNVVCNGNCDVRAQVSVTKRTGEPLVYFSTASVSK